MKKINYTELTEITCTHCQQTKPKSEYYKNKWSYCKSCWQLKDQKYKSKKETVKNIEKPVKNNKSTEKTNKIPPVNLDFDFDFSILQDLEQENDENTVEIDVKSYLNELKNVDNEPEKEIKVAESFTVIDSEGYTRHLSRSNDRTMQEQVESFCLVGRFLVYWNSEKIATGLGDGVNTEIKYKKCKNLFTTTTQTYKILVEFTNNDLEEYSIRTFTERFGCSPISYSGKVLKKDCVLVWKYCISRIEMIKIGERRRKNG